MTRMTEHIGRVLGGRYRLLSAVGSGASARVYLADDVRLRRRVAVKLLHPALADDELFLRRFRAEARAAAALSHPHILAVYDWSGDEDSPYLVTEYLGGGSLRSLLDAGHRLSPSQALVVGLETARALDHAHRQGFVHRDIKTATLMARLEHPLVVPDELGPLTIVLAEAGALDPRERPDAAAFAAGLIAAAEELARPAPLPLAPPHVVGTNGDDPRDRTLVRVAGGEGVALDGAVSGAGASFDAGGVASVGVAAGVVAGNGDSTTVLPRSAPLPPPPAGPPPGAPGDTPPGGTPALSAGDRSARRLMLGALVVAVAVAVGVVGSWLYIRTQVPSHEVPPDLVGAQQDEALELIGGNGWDIVTQRDHYDGTEEGEIVRTVPEPGTSLREGETLTLYVSLGPPLVAVPQDLVGLPVEEAQARLAAPGLELVAEVQEQPSDEVEAGIVIGLGEDVPGQLPRGSTVVLIVSAGPEEPEIPDLEGDDYEDAVAELEAMGLEVELDFRSARGDRDEGEVIRTDPEEGDEVEPGSTVEVVVAGGDVRVPDVEDASLDDASVFGPADGVVDETFPLMGADVEPGSAIDLVMVPAG